MVVAFAAIPRGEVELERHGVPHRPNRRLDGGFRKRRPPKIGVQHDAGQIEQRPQRGAVASLEAGVALNGEIIGGDRDRLAGLERRPGPLERRADRLRGGGTPESLEQGRRRSGVQDRVDRGQVSQAAESSAIHSASISLVWPPCMQSAASVCKLGALKAVA